MSPRPRRSLLDHPALAVGLLVLLLGGALVGPHLPALGSHFLGTEFVDHYGTQWFYWFTERSLRRGDGFGWTELFFYPWGKDIYRDTGANVLDGMAALPLRVLFGPVLGFNLFALLGLAASGLAIAGFARELTGDRAAAAAGGMLGCTVPFLLQELVEGRLTQAIVVLPALTLWAGWRSAHRRGLAPPLTTGLLLALTGYWYWYYALFCGLALLALGVGLTLRPPPHSGGRLHMLGRLSLAAAIAVALVAPVALPLLRATTEGGDVPGLMDTARWTLASVPTVTVDGTEAGLFEWHALRGSFGFVSILADGSGQLADRVTANTLPMTAVLLVGIACCRHRFGLLLLTLAVSLLAAGPVLVVGDDYLGNPVYLALTGVIGPLRRLWWPGRAFALLAVLYGLGAAVLLARLARVHGGLRLLGAVLLALLSLSGMQQRGEVPLPTWDATVPAGFRCLADGPPGGVIQLPFDWAQGHVYYQTAHARPMFGGMRDEHDMFTPRAWQRFRDGNSFARALIAAGHAPDPTLQWTDADADAVHALGYEYVVVQLDSWEPLSRTLPTLAATGTRNRRRRLVNALTHAFGGPVYADARTLIYAPWGAPSPCAADPPAPDAELVGQPDASLATGTSRDTLITPLRKAP